MIRKALIPHSSSNVAGSCNISTVNCYGTIEVNYGAPRIVDRAELVSYCNNLFVDFDS